ncbi:hypothetical protein GCM10025859_17050 [Alicyclobacillus fastidiosus]|nr:hypothetical protein GCM10025859_17050 [Alicyclobacillus fastidiosus]
MNDSQRERLLTRISILASEVNILKEEVNRLGEQADRFQREADRLKYTVRSTYDASYELRAQIYVVPLNSDT